MKQYIAMIRLNKPRGGPGASSGTEPLTSQNTLAARLRRQPGVKRAVHDLPSASMIVSFDRGIVTIADLVRLIEEGGGSVSGVAQSKAGVACGIAEAVGA